MTSYALALTLTLASNIYPTTCASRAYPHGCMYRHPTYYTYDEREDISWADERQLADHHGEGGVSQHHVDFRKLPSKSSNLRRPYERYRLTRKLGAGKFSEVYEAVDLEWGGVPERCERRQRIGVGRNYYDGDITDCTTETEEAEVEEERIDFDSLVVLKVRGLTLRYCLSKASNLSVGSRLMHCLTFKSCTFLDQSFS